MSLLACGIHDAEHYKDALPVQEAVLSMQRRLGAPEEEMLDMQSNVANSLKALGRHDEALKAYRVVYTAKVKHFRDDENTFLTLKCFSDTLCRCAEEGKPHLWAENMSLLREKVGTGVAQRVLGPHHPVLLQLRSAYACAIFMEPSTSREDCRAQLAVFENIARIACQVLGPAHPHTRTFENNVGWVREHPFYTGAPYAVGPAGKIQELY